MPNTSLAIKRAAEKYGVNPTVLQRLIGAESGGNPNAVSPAGARGIAQFMPATAKAYGVNLNDNRISDDLNGAAHYLADNLKRTGGDYRQALSIYNSGRPDGYKSIPETRLYVQKILGGRNTGATPVVPSGAGAKVETSVGSGAPSPDRRALIAQYLANEHSPDALVTLAAGLGSAPVANDTPVTRAKADAKPGLPQARVAQFDGKPVAAWIVPLLQYARARGWRGTVSSGVRTDAEQTRIFRSGVRPAAVPKSLGGAGSKHEQTGFLQGAVDVTDAATLNRILRAKHSRLQGAGAKDPPHFSVPNPDGSY